ncbi:hypothetical protein PJM48_29320, partial [Mycobacterium kansasii]
MNRSAGPASRAARPLLARNGYASQQTARAVHAVTAWHGQLHGVVHCDRDSTSRRRPPNAGRR